MRKFLVPVAGMFLVGAFLVQGLAFLDANSQTFDEAVHLTAGYSYLATGDFRLNAEHPPLVKLLCALPVYLRFQLPFKPDPDWWEKARDHADEPQWWIARDFLYGTPDGADEILYTARCGNLALGACLVMLLGWWAFRLWGPGSALLAMSLAAFEPNLVAHAGLVTTDMASTLFMFSTFYLLWEYSRRPTGRTLAAVGVSLGLALASKFSGLLVLLILVATAGLYLLAGGSLALRPRSEEEGKDLLQRGRSAVPPLLRILCLALLVILPCYFFQGYSTWAYGLRTQMNQQTTGKGSFLLGQFSAHGWWYYFPLAWLIKTPLGSIVLILASLVLLRTGAPLTRREWAFVAVPAALYLLALARLKLNIGLRYALPAYPFLFLLASRLATITRLRALVLTALLCIPLAANVLSSVKICPHYLAYFNELAGGPADGYRALSDSNIDWGQDLRNLRDFMDRQGVSAIYLAYFGTAPPDYYGIRYQDVISFGQLGPPPESILPANEHRQLLAISVVNLQGVHSDDHDLFRWLTERTPIAKIGYSIFVYDLTGDAQAHQELADVYRKTGRVKLLEAEVQKALER